MLNGRTHYKSKMRFSAGFGVGALFSHFAG